MTDERLHIVEHRADDPTAPVVVLVHGTMDNSLSFEGVVAHSYGGAVALLAASLRPDLVASLAVFEPTVAWAAWWPDSDTIREQAVHVQHHFRAGLEGRPRP